MNNHKEFQEITELDTITTVSNRMEFFRSVNRWGISSLVIFYSGRESCLPGHHFGPAVRAQYLLHFITKGKGRFSVNNHTYNLSRNQAFLIQPNITTYYSADSEDPWEYIWIGFDGQDAQVILQNCGLLGKCPFVDYAPNEEMLCALNNIVDGMRNHSANNYQLLSNLFMVFSYLSQNQLDNQLPSENDYLQKAVIYIKNNYYKDLNVQNIADYVGINRSYLYRLFMQEFSISPKKYIFDYRFHIATDLLSNTDMTISAIALNCGFKDISAFCLQFKKYTGFTPKQYRTIDGDKQMTWKPVDFT